MIPTETFHFCGGSLLPDEVNLSFSTSDIGCFKHCDTPRNIVDSIIHLSVQIKSPFYVDLQRGEMSLG